MKMKKRRRLSKSQKQILTQIRRINLRNKILRLLILKKMIHGGKNKISRKMKHLCSSNNKNNKSKKLKLKLKK